MRKVVIAGVVYVVLAGVWYFVYPEMPAPTNQVVLPQIDFGPAGVGNAAVWPYSLVAVLVNHFA